MYYLSEILIRILSWEDVVKIWQDIAKTAKMLVGGSTRVLSMKRYGLKVACVLVLRMNMFPLPFIRDLFQRYYRTYTSNMKDWHVY